MNSLTSLAKMEDEVATISAVYLMKLCSLDLTNDSHALVKSYLYVHRVEEALSSLSEQCRELITNDFINPSSPKWWKSSYSSEYYLKLRYRAVDSFLMHFYD